MHPLLMATYLVMATGFLVPEMVGMNTFRLQGKWIIIGIFALLTFVLPMLSMVVLRVFGNISSIQLEDRSERLLPMAFTTVYYVLAAYVLVWKTQVPLPLAAILISITLTLIFITFATFFWKISAHSAGIWGCTGILFGLNLSYPEGELLNLMIITILLAGALSSARLYLGAHNPAQVAAGAIAGFLICFITLTLMI